MYSIDALDAYDNIFAAVKNRQAFIPPRHDFESKSISEKAKTAFLQRLNNEIKIEKCSKIFTLGCCFMREVEAQLINMGCNLSIESFESNEELRAPQPSLLNTYNVAALLGRIERTISSIPYSINEATEQITNNRWVDLFLNENAEPTGNENLLRIRESIRWLHQDIEKSDMVIISFSLIEGWFDHETGVYITRPPTRNFCLKNPGRFEFRRLGIDEVNTVISKIIYKLRAKTNAPIIILISPVPARATFYGDSLALSSYYQRTVIRACVENIINFHHNVHYFPSLEIFNYVGPHAFNEEYKEVTKDFYATFSKILFDKIVKTD